MAKERSLGNRLSRRTLDFWTGYGITLYKNVKTAPRSISVLSQQSSSFFNGNNSTSASDIDSDDKLLKNGTTNKPKTQAIQFFPSYARAVKNLSDPDCRDLEIFIQGYAYDTRPPKLTRRNRLLVSVVRQIAGLPSISKIDSISPSYGLKPKRNLSFFKSQGSGIRDNTSADNLNIASKKSASSVPVSEPPSRSSTILMNDDHNWIKELRRRHENMSNRLALFFRTPLNRKVITVRVKDNAMKIIHEEDYYTDDKGYFQGRLVCSVFNLSNGQKPDIAVYASFKSALDEDPGTNTSEIFCPVHFYSSSGLSIISDVDDTIKHTAVGKGARAIFRNIFVRDLQDLQIAGVHELYHTLHARGVGFHYVSNSPWQMWPTLEQFLDVADLPTGSVHLKLYSSMLSGLLTSPAERKRGSVESLLRNFSNRRFLLIGDSGEQDLELYVEMAVQFKNQVLAIFIRDVTTRKSTSIVSLSESKAREEFSQQQDKIHPMDLKHSFGRALSDSSLLTIYPRDVRKSRVSHTKTEVLLKQKEKDKLVKELNSSAISYMAAVTTGHKTDMRFSIKHEEAWSRRVVKARDILLQKNCPSKLVFWREGEDIRDIATKLEEEYRMGKRQ